MDIDMYFVIAMLGQMLAGLVMAVGVIVGLRLALPSLARTLARELQTAGLVRAEESAANRTRDDSGPLVTLERRDELRS